MKGVGMAWYSLGCGVGWCCTVDFHVAVIALLPGNWLKASHFVLNSLNMEIKVSSLTTVDLAVCLQHFPSYQFLESCCPAMKISVVLVCSCFGGLLLQGRACHSCTLQK